MTNTTLTAVVQDKDLTAPTRLDGTTVTLTRNDTRITRDSNTRVTRGGNTRITRFAYTGTPTTLTAVLVDKDLTAPEVDNG